MTFIPGCLTQVVKRLHRCKDKKLHRSQFYTATGLYRSRTSERQFSPGAFRSSPFEPPSTTQIQGERFSFLM